MYKFKFPIGQLVATPAAIKVMEDVGEDMFVFVNRHCTGDWGDVCLEDAEANEHALTHGHRIFSAYRLNADGNLSVHQRIWIITEADRSVTTVLLPDDY